MNKPEEREINFDCIHIMKSQRGCSALNKLYCKTEDCAFYQRYNTGKPVPHTIVNNKVYKLKDTQ